MHINIKKTSGYTILRFDGAVGGKLDLQEISSSLDAIWKDSPRSLLLDLEEATLDPPCRALLFAAMLHVTSEGGSSALVTNQIEFSQVFIRLSLQRVAKICSSRDDAFLALLARLKKRYDHHFFNLLVEGQHLSNSELKRILSLYKNGGGKAALGDLLIQQASISPMTILDLLAQASQAEASNMNEVRDLARQIPKKEATSVATKIAATPSPSDALNITQGKQSSKGAIVSEFIRPRLLGEILVEMNVVTEAQLRMVLDEQRSTASEEKIGDTLLRLGLVTTNQLFQALESQLVRKGPSLGSIVLELPEQKTKVTNDRKSSASEFFKSSLLGQLLIREGLVSEQDLRTALEEQQKNNDGERLGDILVRLGTVKPSDLFLALERQSLD